jgi:hypothetical protein
MRPWAVHAVVVRKVIFAQFAYSIAPPDPAVIITFQLTTSDAIAEDEHAVPGLQISSIMREESTSATLAEVILGKIAAVKPALISDATEPEAQEQTSVTRYRYAMPRDKDASVQATVL